MNPDRLLNATDRLGIAASIVCILHCLTLPVVTSLLPFLHLFQVQDSIWFHLGMLVLIVPTTLWAFSNGLRIHRHRSVLLLGGLGLVLVCLGSLLPIVAGHGEVMELIELALILPGSVLLVLGHWRNYYCRINHSNAKHPYH